MLGRVAPMVSTVLLIACASVAASGGRERSVCEPADARSANMLAMVRQFVTATEPDPVAERNQLGFVAASAASVRLVTDAGICDQARTAFNARQLTDGSPGVTSVYVVRAGVGRQRRYVVKAAGLVPDHRNEFGTSLVFDGHWHFKSRFGA